VDPEEEKKRKLERQKLEKKKEVPMIRFQDGTLVPSTAVGHTIPGGSGNLPGQEKPGQARGDFIKNLKQAYQ
jgi:hypothetical protein